MLTLHSSRFHTELMIPFFFFLFEAGFLCVSLAGLELTELPAFASQVLGLKTRVTMSSFTL